ncbi:hypothetical protein CIPAW_08G109100 [Carya illinoinensis]|uniref:Uncharacterized protein n=1 Tax=Carya illinoinensis TaxID=32201 RepID=A0A8T1PY85_CARIL|nr:hypothetical protein CIPAW_08G109100 [Carya illinoinensis]
MAPLPALRSSPERDVEIEYVTVDAKSMAADADTVSGPASVAFLIFLSDIWHLYKGLYPWMGARYLLLLYKYANCICDSHHTCMHAISLEAV